MSRFVCECCWSKMPAGLPVCFSLTFALLSCSACCWCLARDSFSSACARLWKLCVWKLRPILSINVERLSLCSLWSSADVNYYFVPCRGTCDSRAFAALGSVMSTVSCSFSPGLSMTSLRRFGVACLAFSRLWLASPLLPLLLDAIVLNTALLPVPTVPSVASSCA